MPEIMTYDQLVEALSYEPETGEFRWRHRGDVPKKVNTRLAGEIAGTDGKRKWGAYRQIVVGGRSYLAHRLAWLYMTGEWPSAEIDHRDRNGLNNRWPNLREATPSQNGANKGASSTNRCGVKGATFVKRTGKYQAKIKDKGLSKHLGYFDTAEEANAAYLQAAKRLYGEYARAA